MQNRTYRIVESFTLGVSLLFVLIFLICHCWFLRIRAELWCRGYTRCQFVSPSEKNMPITNLKEGVITWVYSKGSLIGFFNRNAMFIQIDSHEKDEDVLSRFVNIETSLVLLQIVLAAMCMFLWVRLFYIKKQNGKGKV